MIYMHVIHTVAWHWNIDPEWASTTLGIFLCIDCAEVHREMDLTRNKVRSIRLDSWSPDMIKVS